MGRRVAPEISAGCRKGKDAVTQCIQDETYREGFLPVK